MRHRHELDPTTHTVELDQLHTLNAALAAAEEARSGPSITARELGMTGVAIERGNVGEALPATALLVRLTYEGPPEYPYIHGHFVAAEDCVAELHTAALQALAQHLHLKQRWGL